MRVCTLCGKETSFPCHLKTKPEEEKTTCLIWRVIKRANKPRLLQPAAA